MIESPVNKIATKAKINLTPKELIDYALARGEGELSANQALVVKTGARTGRSPKDRFIVRDEMTEKTVNWDAINQPISDAKFSTLWERAAAHLMNKDLHFVSKLKVGAHEQLALTVTVVTELAWHNLFTVNLFIRETCNTNLAAFKDWTILNVPSFKTDPTRDGVNSDAVIILNFTKRALLICGTEYAGEMKKGMFSVLNFLLPDYAVLPMHCAANASSAGKTALFFGLSGTGKTTLSADPNRLLIGDDEHGWGKDGVFNFEGGCYAKCIDLSQEREPLIWNAIRYGTVLENVVLDKNTKAPTYTDTSLTQNTRAAYPREFIPNRVDNNRGQEPDALLFLTCDLFGVLPPVSRLTKEQAAYYFLSGYTALVGSTEVGEGSGIKPTFSTCFGAPFFARPASVYANLLINRLRESGAEVYLVNTGWTGGAYGQGGERFSIPTTRSVVSAILDGKLANAEWEVISGFNFEVPKYIEGVDKKLLNPQNNWRDQTAFNDSKQKLINLFVENFKRFSVDPTIVAAGPLEAKS